MRALLRDPLTHFLLAGIALFFLYSSVSGSEEADARTIRVDREHLLRFIQYRTQTFEPDKAAARLDGMNDRQRSDLIDDYVREEALYRQARDYGLASDDYVIKRRLVQKLEYLGQNLSSAETPEETTLKAYFDAQPERYLEPAWITFTHVFFSAGRHGADGSRTLAANQLAELNALAVPFDQATAYGERFHYLQNYVERPLADIADHFGETMAAALADLPVDGGRWQGPLVSEHGSHLVLITGREAERQLSFEEARDRVRQDYLAEAGQTRQRAFYEEVIGNYRIDTALDLAPFSRW